MSASEWPSPDPADELGLVALDYNLSPERLVSAYRNGIFPWPDSTTFSPIPWVCPPQRAILEFDRLHVPRNLRKSQRNLASLRFTVDEAFQSVVAACAASARPGQRGTWITPAMVSAYVGLHRLGHAHSVEAWAGDELVAGLYGVSAAGVFTGESMFHHINDASKLCVLHLVGHLRARGSTWLDIQQLTRHFALLGAHEISRGEFLERLAIERRAARKLFP
ncbi:MAG: leucyl/phenylalanyl-tRNA--protein transferase [Opitutaceae bacterium]